MKLFIQEISNSLSLVAILLLSCTAIDRIAYASDSIQTVVLTGQQAPNADATFSRFFIRNTFSMNNSGQIAIKAELVGTGVESSNDTGIWMYESGTGLRQFIREGDSIPNAEGRFSSFGRLALSNNGQLAFAGSAVNASAEYSGIWSMGGSGLTLVARNGESAPGTDWTFNNLSSTFVVINDNGQVAFQASADDPNANLIENNIGIWRESQDGTLELVVREGVNAPGTTNIFHSLPSFDFNAAGEVAFGTRLEGLTGFEQDFGVWSNGRRDAIELVVRTGDPAPGTNANFDFVAEPVLSSNGSAAFRATLSGPGVTGVNNQGIWRDNGNGAVELILRDSSAPAPGTRGANFDSFRNLAYNNSGQIAFFADIFGRGTNADSNQGVWSERQDTGLALIARTGNVAPGSELPFRHIDADTLAFNDNGQAAFLATIRDSTTAPRPSDFTGIWAQDLAGELRLIVLEGQQLDVSDDPSQAEFKTIATLDFFNRSRFNDVGQLLFSATFTDGSNGIFVSNLVAIPEPSTQMLLTISWLALSSQMVRCRRNRHSRF